MFFMLQEPSPHAAAMPATALPASITSSMPLPVMDAMNVDNEDSMDGPPPSVGSAPDSALANTPITKKVKTPGKKTVTPYILFSSETRRVITDQHKNCSFGEISRIVGDKVNIANAKIVLMVFFSSPSFLLLPLLLSGTNRSPRPVQGAATKFSRVSFG